MHDFLTLTKDSNSANARVEFEQITRELINAEFGDANRVDDRAGDGGIDVATGEDEVGWTVYQCKYFDKKIGDSQKSQIRKSYKKAKETLGDKLNKWVLCIPIEMDNKALKWWKNWKNGKSDEDDIKIKLMDGDAMQELLDNHPKIKKKHFKSLTLRDEQINKIEVIEESHYEDKKLFKQFCKDVGNAVVFIAEHDFAVNLTNIDWIYNFEDIVRQWNRPDNRFDNEELEDLQGEFVVSLNNLISYLSFAYFDSDDGKHMRAIKKPDRKLFNEMYENTLKYRGEVVETYEEMNKVDKRLRKEAKIRIRNRNRKSIGL